VRQVLDQELQKTIAQKESAARQARLRGSAPHAAAAAEPAFDNKENTYINTLTLNNRNRFEGTNTTSSVKKDFFGRVIVERPLGEVDGNAGGGGSGGRKKRKEEGKEAMVWVTYHEGLNNAVRKPISLEEFLTGL
jgi:chromosome transmission fidelity protein 18